MTPSYFIQELPAVTFTHGLVIHAPKLKNFIKEPSWAWPMPKVNYSPQAPKITLSKSVKTVSSSRKSRFKAMPNPSISTMELYLQQPNLDKFLPSINPLELSSKS